MITALLYWDCVGTIAPSSVPDGPNEFTAELARLGLIDFFRPMEARTPLEDSFLSYLDALADADVQARREAFLSGGYIQLHQQKFLMSEPIGTLVERGLAERQDWEWLRVETATAREYMAALALALTEPATTWRRGGPRREQGLRTPPMRWRPATDGPSALGWFTGTPGTRSATATGDHGLRVSGAERMAGLREVLLQRVLPIPAGHSIPAERIADFRGTYGPEMRAFRREVEAQAMAVAAEPDPTRQVQMIDAFAEATQDTMKQADEMLRSKGFRVVKATLHALLSLASGDAGIAADSSAIGGHSGPIQPLAYASFVQQRIFERRVWPVTPATSGLASAFGY